jgi:nicotinate-nucleotide adenylyltransferase
MKIGFFGGSFDPPHRGHIALAQLAMQRLGLDRVLFAPVGLQPLKRHRPQAGFDDRVAMTRLAIEGRPGLEVSLIDAPRPDHRPNYTLDTIRSLRASLPDDSRVYFLMGADSFLTIGQWHRAVDLLFACDFIVAARLGFDPGVDCARLTDALPGGIVAEPFAAPDLPQALTLRNASGRESHLYLLPDLAERASATTLREALERGDPVEQWPRDWLDPRVAAYIREHHLYRQPAQP